MRVYKRMHVYTDEHDAQIFPARAQRKGMLMMMNSAGIHDDDGDDGDDDDDSDR